MPGGHLAGDLIALFNKIFSATEQTCLVRGGSEPVYLPGAAGALAQVVFAHGFFASALHEVAHWCLAGERRRQLQDYGYWYRPDDRSPAEQQEFNRVEVKPQALEWIFAEAAAFPFQFSADNLTPGGAEVGDEWRQFQRAVAAQARDFVSGGLPPRAARFVAALSEQYQTGRRWAEPERYWTVD